MGYQEDIKATWTQRKAAARDSMRPEFKSAIGYINGDMQSDTDSILASRYRAAQSGGRPESMIEAVSVALVQQYVDEMASLYTGTVTRRIFVDDKEDEELTDTVNEHLDRIGYNQRMRAIERVTILAKSVAQAWGVENGMLDPVMYPPQDTYPVKPKGQKINPTNQDVYSGHVLDTNNATYDGYGERSQRSFVYSSAEALVSYNGRTVREFNNVRVQKNPLMWDQPKIDGKGRPQGNEKQSLQPVVIWHNEMPTSGELMPLNIPIIYRANRWMNALWSVILNVLRFQAGATEVRTGVDRDTTQMHEPVGVMFPALLEPGEDMKYANPANDFDGAFRLLNAFAKTLGQSLSLSPNDLSIDGKVEAGIAKLIANIPKERRRSERAEHFSLLESEYVWPRIASGMMWLGTLPTKARNAYMTIEYRPKPLPLSQTEQIAVENHDLEIGITTPAQIMAARNGTTTDDAQAAINSMRSAQDEAAKEDLTAGQPLTGPQVTALTDTLAKVGDGTLEPESAKALLQVSFKLTDVQVDAIINPIIEAEAEQQEAEAVPSEPQPAGPQGPPPTDQPQSTDDKPGNGTRSLIERLVKGKPSEGADESDGQAT